MAADWKDVLSRLSQDPGLPAGEDMASESVEVEKKAKDTLRVLIDRKGRKGKVATIVEGFTCGDEDVAEIAARLKKKLGVGGSSRGGEILIQGDLAQKVRQLLIEEGFKVK